MLRSITMDAAVWTAIGLLAATSLGTLFYLGARIDALGARIDGLGGRTEGKLDLLEGRFEPGSTLSRVGSRLGSTPSRVDSTLGSTPSRVGWRPGSPTSSPVSMRSRDASTRISTATPRTYRTSAFDSAKALTANSRSSFVCAADTCARILALPFGTTGYENPIT
jgi:hypothetical protein